MIGEVVAPNEVVTDTLPAVEMLPPEVVIATVEVGAPVEVDGKVQLPIVIHATIELPHVDGTAISGIDTQSIAAHITNALQSADIPEDDTDITLHLKDNAA